MDLKTDIKSFVATLGEMYKLFGDAVVEAWAEKEIKRIIEKHKNK